MFNYDELVSFYDQKYRKMLMEQYSGRQKAYEEAVKFFTGGSKKYTKDNPRHTPSEKRRKWTRLNPSNPLPNERVIIAFGNAAMNYNMAGTLPISLQKFKHHLQMASNRLGVFTAGTPGIDPDLIGKKKLEVVMIPEPFTSQIASCIFNALNGDVNDPHYEPFQACKETILVRGEDHPARLIEICDQVVDGDVFRGARRSRIYAVKKCRHCFTAWNRDINAARNILRIYQSILFRGDLPEIFRLMLPT
jgi:hypothetical protein